MSNVIELFKTPSLPTTLSAAKPSIESLNELVTTGGYTTDDMLFHVDSLDLFTGEHGQVKSKKGIFVGDKNINIVSDRYEVHQPVDVLSQFKDVADRSGLEIQTVMPNRNNGGLMISAKHSQCRIMDEEHDINLVFYTSHCGKYKTVLTCNMLRMACFNQLPALNKAKNRFIFAEKHFKNALDIKLIGNIVETLPAIAAQYADQAELLAGTSFNFDKLAKVYAEHYKLNKEAARYQSRIDKLNQAYYHAKGQAHLRDSAYKAYQAITFLNTHAARQTANVNETVMLTNTADSAKFMERLIAVA